MVRFLYYKLPSEAGENVLATDRHIYPDSELAALVEEDDLRLPFFEIMYEVEDEEAKPVAVYVPREDADTPHEPYFVVDDNGVVGLLPFKDANNARHFAYEAFKRYQLMKEKFDA